MTTARALVSIVALLVPGLALGQESRLMPSQLLPNPAVQRELRLTESQKAEIAKRMGEHREEARKSDKTTSDRLASLRNPVEGSLDAGARVVPTEAIQAASREANRLAAERGDRHDRELRKILTTEQSKRLLGIYLQRLGARAFKFDELIRALNIDSDKRAEIDAILAAGDASLKPHVDRFAAVYQDVVKPYKRDDGAVDYEAYRKAVEADPELGRKVRDALAACEAARGSLSDQTRLKILKTLTKRQQDAYRKMQGEPFDLGRPAAAPASAPARPAEPPAPTVKPLSERRGVSK